MEWTTRYGYFIVTQNISTLLEGKITCINEILVKTGMIGSTLVSYLQLCQLGGVHQVCKFNLDICP